MDLLKTIAAIVVTLVLGLGGVALITPNESDLAEDLRDSLGALTSPDIASPYLSWGGIRVYKAAIPLKTATSTVCAIQGPSATSTLLSAGVKVDTASSTATIWNIARSSTAFATTTAIGTAHNVGASATDFILASTSPAAGEATIFAPNQWLVVGVQAAITAGDEATALGFAPVGECHATFEAYPGL